MSQAVLPIGPTEDICEGWEPLPLVHRDWGWGWPDHEDI